MARGSALSAGFTTLVDAPGAVGAIAASAGALAYSIRLADGRREVRLIPPQGAAWTLATTTDTVIHLAIDQVNVYWIDGSVLYRVGRNGGSPAAIGGRVANRITSLHADRGTAYASTDHDIVRMTAGSASWTVFANMSADDLLLDGTEVYWASESRGVIEKASMFGSATATVAFSIHPRGFAVDTTSRRRASTRRMKKPPAPRSRCPSSSLAAPSVARNARSRARGIAFGSSPSCRSCFMIRACPNQRRPPGLR